MSLRVHFDGLNSGAGWCYCEPRGSRLDDFTSYPVLSRIAGWDESGDTVRHLALELGPVRNLYSVAVLDGGVGDDYPLIYPLQESQPFR